MVEYWDNRIAKENIRIIDWTPYYLEDPWKGNVVCIGMSAGFIEPIESTGLALVQFQAHQLMSVLRSGTYDDDYIEIYNKDFKIRFEDCVDFASAHYSKTNRTEKFWNYVKQTYKPTKGIATQLKLLEDGPRHLSQKTFTQIFGGTNWTTWMAQLGYKIGEDKSITQEYGEHILLKWHNTTEKFRPSWSRDHSTEIERISINASYYK